MDFDRSELPILDPLFILWPSAWDTPNDCTLKATVVLHDVVCQYVENLLYVAHGMWVH